MKKIIFPILTAFTLNSYCQQMPALVPAPATIRAEAGNFVIDAKTVISVTPALNKEAALLQNFIKSVCDFSLTIHQAKAGRPISNYISLELNKDLNTGAEGYALTATSSSIVISGNTKAGVFYGLQTLFQLGSSLIPQQGNTAAQISIPAVSIEDFPRFWYRGMHLDVARHFSTVSFVKKYIDYLAAYKFNTFHWHLTDDQGWRIEIKNTQGSPKLVASEMVPSLGGTPVQEMIVFVMVAFIRRRK